MEEKIREEFNKDWNIDYELICNEYYKTCIKFITKTLNNELLENKEKIKKIKEILEELENEISEI